MDRKARVNMAKPVNILVTFDVDGTLIESEGDDANRMHKEAFSHGFKEVRLRDSLAPSCLLLVWWWGGVFLQESALFLASFHLFVYLFALGFWAGHEY